ncbi:DUF2799 domain-containing protein [Curvibacter sp. HBC28]|uniref:DUF2799 domain-containing protein n=2 Tax=Curvibacter microcysteis TaxID=3026419 RepID=A0ABT5MIU4_9BURK|nr:DUF2799 domain-containing protein [Curvibacter sp. HBC28]MDD0816336.1 DUF2799 domain-containing protein [Curvibacter sp. HBC28]
MRVLHGLTALLMVFLLHGCATMSADECKYARWNEVGLRDGLAGEPLSTLNARTQDCAEARVTPDSRAYLQGRDQGLQSYCRLDNAVQLGLNGKSYQGVCPAPIDLEFRRRFSLGREVYDARQQINQRERRRDELERRLKASNKDEDRRKIRDELEDEDRKTRRARDRLRDAEWQLDRLR